MSSASDDHLATDLSWVRNIKSQTEDKFQGKLLEGVYKGDLEVTDCVSNVIESRMTLEMNDLSS